MPSFDKPTSSQIFSTLSPSGDGSSIGSWDGTKLTNNDTNSLIPIITTEYDYAVDLLQAAGYDETALTDAELAIANKAVVNAIAHQMVQTENNSLTTISGTPQDGIRQKSFNQRTFSFALLAQAAWDELAITSKYDYNYTSGFSRTTQERENINPQESYYGTNSSYNRH